jgi:hypothetical protein
MNKPVRYVLYWLSPDLEGYTPIFVAATEMELFEYALKHQAEVGGSYRVEEHFKGGHVRMTDDIAALLDAKIIAEK